MKGQSLILGAVIAYILTGCAYEGMKKEVDQTHLATEDYILAKQRDIVPANPAPRSALVRAKGSWVGNKAVPLSQEATLPPVFLQEVTLIFPGRVNLRTVADRITKVTGIPVRLKPDVFMASSQFVGGGASAAPTAALPALPGLNSQGLPPLPSMNMLGASAYQPAQNTADEFELNYTGSLADLLNLVASRFGINWEFSEVNGIMYSRLVTKSFTIKANPGDSSFTASLGKASTSGGSSFSSDGQVKMNSTFSVWDGVQRALDTIKSSAGKFHVSQATGTVTITDTKEVVDLAEQIIKNENVMLTKQVALRLEMYSVRSSDNLEEGVDWNVVFTKFSQLAPQFALSMISPASLVSANAGSVGVSVLSSIGGSSGSFEGSEAFVRSLQGEGKVARVQSVSAMTLNRQPVPIGVTNQQSYLASTAAGTSTNGVATQPGLTPGQVTTGFLANLLPTVLDSNSVLLQFSIDMTELKNIGIVSVGSGITQQSIQTPNVDGVQFVQRVALKAGSTLVLTGFERFRDNYDMQGLTKSVGLGGSMVGNKSRESMVILITPLVVDGAI